MAASEVDKLADQLRGYLTHIPPTQGWSVQRVRSYKAAVASGLKLLQKRGVKPGELSAKINELHGFWP